jgi:hypothetical protein
MMVMLAEDMVEQKVDELTADFAALKKRLGL